jgi:pilus assembly protein CpaB
MNSRRLLLALLIALLFSGGVTFFVSRKLANRGSTSRFQQYVAAARALQPGEVLKAEDLKTIEWPASKPLAGAYARIADLSGRALIYPVAASQPVLQDFLAAPGSVIGLTTKIPEGMRATSVKSDEVLGVAGFLFPGAHVDVLVTLRDDRSPIPTTQIVLQDVEVLTVGQRLQPDPQGKPESVNVVTLLLTPQDSQKLVLASSQGGVQFVMRNGADHTRISATPMRIAQLSGPLPAPVVVAAPRRAPLPAKQEYVVETIAGDKRATHSFSEP